MCSSSKPDGTKELRKAGDVPKLTYTPKEDNSCSKEKQQQRKRNITWFNPPSCKHVRMNVGRKFLALVEHHFPKEHQPHKVCSRNNLEVGYGCMDNLDTIKNADNSKIINTGPEQTIKVSCTSRKEDCPIPYKRMAKSIMYEDHLMSKPEGEAIAEKGVNATLSAPAMT
ncbi:uncharacterized protein [Diadema setosum]|uniref:uncharacterized protein n=1 Tax=Diadema setosum TaxID=31175 RepID=UPI003B3BD380